MRASIASWRSASRCAPTWAEAAAAGAGATADSIILLQTDAGTPVGLEREVTEMALGKGFRLALVGSNTPAIPPTDAPQSEE